MLVATWIAPRVAHALEPVLVTVEAALEMAKGDTAGSLRQKLFAAALEKAVLEVASRYVPPDRLARDGDALRQAIGPQAERFILSYRADAPPAARPSLQKPNVQELAVTVTATVDAERLRQRLQELGFAPAAGGPRPSVAIRCEVETRRDPQGRLVDLGVEPVRQFFSERLAKAGFVVVEPAQYGGAQIQPSSAVELARSVGADLGIDVRIVWTPAADSGAVSGGIGEVRATAARSRDATELALVRFEAPGYGADPNVAFARAVDGLREQVASSLVFQLEQNLAAIQQGGAAVRVRLSGVRGLGQVELVQKVLVDKLGAKQAQLALLESGSAELVVQGSLSPGALQERLVGAAYDGFQLQLVGVQSDRVELRVAPDLTPDGDPAVRSGKAPAGAPGVSRAPGR